MTGSKVWLPLAGLAVSLLLGTTACDQGGPEQQSSNPVAEQPADAAATTESQTQKSE